MSKTHHYLRIEVVELKHYTYLWTNLERTKFGENQKEIKRSRESKAMVVRKQGNGLSPAPLKVLTYLEMTTVIVITMHHGIRVFDQIKQHHSIQGYYAWKYPDDPDKEVDEDTMAEMLKPTNWTKTQSGLRTELSSLALTWCWADYSKREQIEAMITQQMMLEKIYSFLDTEWRGSGKRNWVIRGTAKQLKTRTKQRNSRETRGRSFLWVKKAEKQGGKQKKVKKTETK